MVPSNIVFFVMLKEGTSQMTITIRYQGTIEGKLLK